MDMLRKLSPAAQVVLGGAVLYLIFSFFDWQQACGGVGSFKVCGGRSEWNGIGVLAALLVIALLVWEVARLLEVKIELGGITPGLISLGLALALLLFTFITFITHDEARHWPSWIGLILSILIAAAAWIRGRQEGMELPDLGAMRGTGSSSGPPPAPPPDTPPRDESS